MRQIILEELLDAIEKGETTRFRRLLYGRGRRRGLNGYQLAVAVNLNTGLQGNSTLLHKAAQHGRVDIVKFLIKAGVKLNTRWRSTKRTALHIAARNGNLNIINALLKAGALVNLRDSIGLTPLDCAHQHCDKEDERYHALREAGAKFSYELFGRASKRK